MDNSAQFTIIYDGPALETNVMDVKEIAPSLLSIGDLLEEANHVMFSGKASIKVNVKSGFEAGSFGVEFILDQNFLSKVVDLFNSDNVNAALNLVEILGLGGGTGFGLIKFIKWLGKRKISKITTLESGNVKIEVGKDSVEINQTVLDLLQNLKIRKSLEEIISKPLSRDGVDRFSSFTTKTPESEKTRIEKGDGELFSAPSVDEEKLSEDTLTKNLQLVSVNFVEGNKWKFSDGSATFFAEVLAEDFVHRVQNNEEAFAKDDILKVRLKETQWSTSSGLKTEYQIMEVLDHKQPKLQIKLPLSTDTESTNNLK